MTIRLSAIAMDKGLPESVRVAATKELLEGFSERDTWLEVQAIFETTDNVIRSVVSSHLEHTRRTPGYQKALADYAGLQSLGEMHRT